MSLRPTELRSLAVALTRALAGAVVQKIGSSAPLRIELELRTPGRTTRLLVVAEPEVGRLSVVEKRAPAAGPPSAWLLRLRKELVGTRLVDVTCPGGRELELRFSRQAQERTLVVELGAPGALLLLGDARRPVAAAGERARAPRPPNPFTDGGEGSRLPPLDDGVELARAVEALFAVRERGVRAAVLRRLRVQPLRVKVDRLRRTVEKVRLEANRGEAAESHRRFGELLRQNPSAVGRGATAVTLTEYTEEGARAVEVPLDPGLDARAQAERHFQRYRRLSRGNVRAATRLVELERELGEAEMALSAARELSEEALLASAPGAAPPARKARPAIHQPYRVFRSRSGERILVGRAGRDNDALSFAIARPDDLWLHARGIPGAHVVVPLPRGAEVSEDTLLDAAHLALHHARGAGADRGEVSYTRAKFVRRAKGGAPGAVTYSREKTFLVRLEQERLERLLASREER